MLFIPKIHNYIKCPKGCCDGNDDKILDQNVLTEYGCLDIYEIKQCDICGDCYEVVTKYKLTEQFQV